MKGRGVLALSTVVGAAAALLPATGAGATSTPPPPIQKVFTSGGCRSKVNFYIPVTWACTTVAVVPAQVQVGGTTTVTYSFKAKRTLKYVTVCFSKVLNLDDCAYTHNFRVLKRGQVIRREVQLTTPPSMPVSGAWLFDNSSHFYKRWSKLASRSAPYWPAHSYVRIVAAN